MAKKKSWFYLFKKLFASEEKPKPEQKQKRWKWVFGRLKTKRLATLTAPSPPKMMTREEAEEDQSKQALSVAIASTVAAEAAVAAAKAAVEVVLLTGTPQPIHHQYEEETAELNPSSKTLNKVPSSRPYKREREIQELAAIKIQTAFRGYLSEVFDLIEYEGVFLPCLYVNIVTSSDEYNIRIERTSIAEKPLELIFQAKKALRALKGIVRLQAIIRGRAVRRQAIATLKCLQSIVSIQSQVCSNRLHIAENTFHSDESKQFEKTVTMDSKDQKWDGSMLSKQERDALFLSRKEAVIERERVKEYSFSHRRSAESERKKMTGRWRYWLDQWVDTQLSKSKELEDLDSIFTSNPKPKEIDRFKPNPIKLKENTDRGTEIVNQSPKPVSKRLSHHRRQCSLGGDDINNSLSNSPILPTYMAATESARAKARSLSSPKLRPAGGVDVCSDGNSPCKIKQLCLVSSMASEGAIGGGRNGRPSCYQQQRSPGLKGLPGPTRSGRSLKDLSVDSECSLTNWDRESAFR